MAVSIVKQSSRGSSRGTETPGSFDSAPPSAVASSETTTSFGSSRVLPCWVAASSRVAAAPRLAAALCCRLGARRLGLFVAHGLSTIAAVLPLSIDIASPFPACKTGSTVPCGTQTTSAASRSIPHVRRQVFASARKYCFSPAAAKSRRRRFGAADHWVVPRRDSSFRAPRQICVSARFAGEANPLPGGIATNIIESFRVISRLGKGSPKISHDSGGWKPRLLVRIHSTWPAAAPRRSAGRGSAPFAGIEPPAPV